MSIESKTRPPVETIDEIDIRELLKPVTRRELFLIGAATAVAGLTAFGVESQKKPEPVYKATLRVKIESGSLPSASSPNQPFAGDTVENHVLILNGETFKLEVAKGLGFKVDEQTAQTTPKLPFDIKASRVSPTSQLINISIQGNDPVSVLRTAQETIIVAQKLTQKRQTERFASARERVERQVNALQKQIEDLESRGDSSSLRLLEEARGNLQRLQTELSISYLTSEPFSDRIVVIEPPRLPEKPISSWGFLTAPVTAATAVFVAASVGVILWEKFLNNSRIRTLSEAERDLGLSVLGQLYKVKGSQNGVAWSHTGQNGESFNRLRILLGMLNPQLETLCVASAEPGEGKSTVALGLAASLAAIGKRVVVVDLDFRKPSLHSTVGVKKQPGILNWVNEQVELNEITRLTKEGFYVVTAGSSPDNTSETNLLEDARFLKLIVQLKKKFKVVIFDPPPYMAGADILTIAGQSDGTIFVVDVENTRKDPATEAVKDLGRHTILLGMVVNNLPLPKRGYYGAYGADGGKIKNRVR